jgi:hypothetical protein
MMNNIYRRVIETFINLDMSKVINFQWGRFVTIRLSLNFIIGFWDNTVDREDGVSLKRDACDGMYSS